MQASNGDQAISQVHGLDKIPKKRTKVPVPIE